METRDWLTLAALLLGPVVAVALTLWIEGQRRRRESRLVLLRQLMATRHLPSDPLYSTAVNLLPVEFNDDRRVMESYKEYQAAVSQVPGDNPDAIAASNQKVTVAQTKMLFAVMRAMNLKASEADLPVEAYAARAMIERDNLWLNSLRGTARIADALELQVRLMAGEIEAQQQPANK